MPALSADLARAWGARPHLRHPHRTAGELTVFFPGGFRAFATPVASATVVDPTTGQQRFGSWMIYGMAQSLAGAAITVDAGGS